MVEQNINSFPPGSYSCRENPCFLFFYRWLCSLMTRQISKLEQIKYPPTSFSFNIPYKTLLFHKYSNPFEPSSTNFYLYQLNWLNNCTNIKNKKTNEKNRKKIVWNRLNWVHLNKRTAHQSKHSTVKHGDGGSMLWGNRGKRTCQRKSSY